MRTPVVLLCGQGATDDVARELQSSPGTVLVRHAFDGHVVVRSVATGTDTSEWALELAHGCVSCTVRDDLLVLLRRLHRRSDVRRIVVVLMAWLEPEPVCWAIENIEVQVGPGYIDGPAARDVRIDGVVTCIDTAAWLPESLGEDELDDGRTVAQVVVGQAELADVLVLTEPESTTLAVLRRLSPTARITTGPERVELALSHLEPNSRRGRPVDPHDPLLTGEPPLDRDGEVGIVEFVARRPFHPVRLHEALDVLLDGVVRARGRAWLASQPDDVVYLESAGGGLRVSHAGRWLAAMDHHERAYADPQRLALAAVGWDERFGDRHISLTAIVCGARPDDIVATLRDALLTDDELEADWTEYPDPFGDWHEEPCETPVEETANPGHHEGERS